MFLLLFTFSLLLFTFFLVHQDPEVGLHRRRQPLEAIATLQNRDQTAVAVLVGDPFDDASELAVAFRRHPHAAERVILVGIKAGGDKHELRGEGQGRRTQLLPVPQ